MSPRYARAHVIKEALAECGALPGLGLRHLYPRDAFEKPGDQLSDGQTEGNEEKSLGNGETTQGNEQKTQANLKENGEKTLENDQQMQENEDQTQEKLQDKDESIQEKLKDDEVEQKTKEGVQDIEMEQPIQENLQDNLVEPQTLVDLQDNEMEQQIQENLQGNDGEEQNCRETENDLTGSSKTYQNEEKKTFDDLCPRLEASDSAIEAADKKCTDLVDDSDDTQEQKIEVPTVDESTENVLPKSDQQEDAVSKVFLN